MGKHYMYSESASSKRQSRSSIAASKGKR